MDKMNIEQVNNALDNVYRSLLEINNDVYENVLQKLYSLAVIPGDSVVDVGAHVGRHTMPMAEMVGDEGKVYAFEPLPNLYARLSEIIKLHGFDKVVNLYPFALSNEEGVANFLDVKDAQGLSGLKERTSHNGHSIDRITVEVRVLDKIIPEDCNITFMKLDAEGADFYILQGARRILEKNRPLVVFESGRIKAFPARSYDYSESEFNAFFDEINYVLYDIAGFKYDSYFWDKPTLNDFVAIPAELEDEGRQLLIMAVVSTLSENWHG